MLKEEFAIQAVLHAHDVLQQEEDLSPNNERINIVLSHLVNTLCLDYSPEQTSTILNDPRIADIREPLLERLSQAEGEMEKFWAGKFLAQDHLSSENLKDFQYWGCYDRLVKYEIGILPPGVTNTMAKALEISKSRVDWTDRRANYHDKGAVFVGAGPLPISAIMLHERLGVPVICVDIDPEACDLSDKMIRKMGLTGMSVVQADGAKLKYDDISSVFIASLVRDKKQIIDKVRESNTLCHVLARSVKGVHALLYEPVDENIFTDSGCMPSGETPYDPSVINTTIAYVSDPKRKIRPHVDKAPQGSRKYTWFNAEI